MKNRKQNFIVNSYEISYNSFWKKWQVWHDEIGFCEDFLTKEEAIEYAEKG